MDVLEGYDYLEKIITYGFLPSTVRYKDNVIVFKTISDKEYKQISFYNSGGDYNWSLYRLAFSTFMINGSNCLNNREEAINKLLEFYSKIPITGYLKFLQDVDELHNIYLDSLKFLEGFCYTGSSRVLWRVFDTSVADTSYYYGIPGIKNVGLNNAQENWIVINKQLDEEEDYNTQFRLSLMVASSFNGKGAQQIGSRFDFHKKELDDLREEIAKYGYDKRRIEKKKEEDGWAQPLRTREELVKELNRQMSGDKDKHDQFLDKCIEGERRRAEDAKTAAAEKQKQFRDNLKNDVDLTKMEGSRIATAEEIKELFNKDKKKELPGSMASSAFEGMNSKERILKKVGKTKIKKAS
jgi:hypothetical protein